MNEVVCSLVLVLLLGIAVVPSHGEARCEPVKGVPTINVDTEMVTPSWAVKEREILDLNTKAVELWDKAYLLPNGHRCMKYGVGGGQSPDDYYETFFKLPIVYILGAGEPVREVWWKAIKGNVSQCTEEGFYVNEFIKSMEGYHIGEQYGNFFNGALMMFDDPEYRRLALKFASFYDGSNPEVPNYDPVHKVMRSAMHGGNGPLLDNSKFDPVHTKYWTAVEDYAFESPANMTTTCFLTNAYAMTGDVRYKKVALDYINAWRDRTKANGGIVPTKVRLDGTIPDDWWGGVLGWTSDKFTGGFVVTAGPTAGWSNGTLLSGDTSYWDNWRHMADEWWKNRYTNDKGEVTNFPARYSSDLGWYGTPWYGDGQGVYSQVMTNIYLATMKKEDLSRCLERSMLVSIAGFGEFYEIGYEFDWIRWLAGKNPEWVDKSLDKLIDNCKKTNETLVKEIAAGQHTERSNATGVGWCGPLVHLMMGAVVPKWNGQPLLARFRYFDPEQKKMGITADCAAMIESMSDDSATLMLVNTSPTTEHTVLVQTGAYAEHQCLSVKPEGGSSVKVNGTLFAVKLAPQSGKRFVVSMKRYANAPTLRMPWGK